MKMSKLDKLNANTSKLGFGLMRLPRKDDKIDQEQVNEMVKYAYENGVNYYDTAYLYGDGASEISLGIALKHIKREEVFIADKLPMRKITSKESMDELFNTSLERLQTDYIDFYLLHALERGLIETITNYDVIDWAIQKKKEGKIKYIGFSIHDNYETLLKILDLYDWDFAQIQFNYMDLLDQPGELGYLELKKRNIPIIIMEPLKGGMLAALPEKIAEPFKALGDSNVKYAFRWLAEKEGIATILSGMSNMAQIIENIEIFKDIQPLKEEEHQAILEVEKRINALQKVNCTACRYCMPCPFGVRIPNIFRAWNTKSMNQGSNWISGGNIDYESAEKCTECEACMVHCPQHIQIPEKLKQVLAERV